MIKWRRMGWARDSSKFIPESSANKNKYMDFINPNSIGSRQDDDDDDDDGHDEIAPSAPT